MASIIMKRNRTIHHQLTPVFLLLWEFVAFGHPLDTWHVRQPGSGYGDLLGVCYGAGLFVTVGSGGAVYTSVTGENWTLQVSCTTNWLCGIAYGNGVFVAAGDAGTIISSSDGTNWNTQVSGVTNSLRSLIFGNGLFVALGSHLSLTSENGASWSAHTIPSVVNSAISVYGNGLFVIEGPPG
jgi:hypothetical protein